MRIDSSFETDGSYCIWLSNFVMKRGLFFPSLQYNSADDPMPRFIEVMKCFAKDDEMFFGHYQNDGLNLTSEEYIQYSKEIPEFFKTYGRYEELVTEIKKKRKANAYVSYLTVCSSPLNFELYRMIPKLFHYYLETTCFCPKIDWETFVQIYHDYMKHGGRAFVMNGFTDFMFSYADSGKFSVSFDPSLHNPDTVHDEIRRLLFDVWEE